MKKWLAYAGWFMVWFVLHSFIFNPIISKSGGIVAAIAAVINIGIAVFGFRFIHKKFATPAKGESDTA